MVLPRPSTIFDAFRACASNPEKLEALYRRLYIYSPTELKLLGFLGLVQRVDLDGGAADRR